MKNILTTVLVIAFAAYSLGQSSGRTPADNREAAGNNSIPVRNSDEGSTSEAVAVLNTIRQGLKTETGTQSVFTEAEYRTLIGNADNFMLERKYDNAFVLYNEVLKNKDDQYAKDRILEVQALRAKQQQKEEQQQKDEILRANAKQALSDTYMKHSVHFTGALMSDVSSTGDWTTEAFNRNDPYSDFLKPGKYDDLSKNMLKAKDFSLDGIAVPANTRLIVYKEPGCRGEVLLDVTGPAIVNNVYRISDKRFKTLSSKQFHEVLQSYFPQETRSWSKTNMHNWTNGSMEITIQTKE
jgi:hypothetical protein